MPKIHQTAIVESGAVLADDVEVGPFTIIGPQVTVGAGTKIGPHVNLAGKVTIGERNRLFHSVSIGEPAQDVSANHSDGEVVIGSDNILREYANVHQPAKQGGKTIIGNNVFMMANSHVAHDCHIGNHVIMVNYAGIAGHAHVGDYALVSGLCMVHQFVRIGAYSVLGGCSKATRDTLPFSLNNGNPAVSFGLNLVGLKRNKFSPAERTAIKNAYQLFYLKGLSQSDAIKAIKEELLPSLPENSPEKNRIQYLTDFLISSKRGYTFHNSQRPASGDEDIE